MSWKKNAFSCLMWLLYLLMIGTAMIFVSKAVCDSFGVAAYYEFVIPGIYLLITGIIVLLLHRMAVRLNIGSRSMGKGLEWMERILILILFAAGIFLRVTKLPLESDAASDESVYLKLAYISEDGGGIPQFSHGAVYLYIWALRLCFLMLGNKAAVAVWLQIALQMFGILLLYFAVQKMAGRVPAIMMASFFVFSPDMVGKSLKCSPEMLYLLLFSLVLLFISRGVEYVFDWEFWLVAGMMTAALSYLDVAGFLLLPVMLGAIIMRRQDADKKIIRGLCGCLAGFLSGATGCFFADAISSGKPVFGIIGAWAELYRWSDVQLSVTLSGFDMVWSIMLLLCFMAWGIFSFWCGRGTERFTVWIFCLCIAILMQCLGIFTEEMNGFGYIFFFSTVLAGLGIRESMAACPAENTEEIMSAEEDESIIAGVNGKYRAQTVTESKTQIVKEQSQGKNGDGSQDEIAGNRDRKEGEFLQDPEGHMRNTEKEKGTVGEEKDKTDSTDSIESKNNETEEQQEKRKIEFLENPLPLPKKHEKRVMDYKLDSGKDLGGYDVYVADDDDFDH